jgi:hypothetical protein
VSQGYIIGGEYVTHVSVQLLPEDGDSEEWPTHKLGLSPVPYEELEDKEARWGKYFPPDKDSNRWPFFMRFPMDDEQVEYFDGTWEVRVNVSTLPNSFEDGPESVSFELDLHINLEKPWVRVTTAVHGRTFNGSTVVVEGAAGDDYQLVFVQTRLDGGDWLMVSTDEEWSYALDTGALGDGTHTIDFRAFDGVIYSDINTSTFQVWTGGGSPGNGDDGSGWDTQTLVIAAGAVLLVVALALVLAITMVRRRSPPDSSGEG